MKSRFVFFTALLFYLSLSGQCPDRDYLWNRIIYLRDSSNWAPEKQLDELSSYQKAMNQCGYRNDSTNAFLLQRIGWLYTKKDDFNHAILYTQKSIAMVDEHKNNSAINQAMSIKSYFNLYFMYDSLKLETKKIAACDSCISLAVSLQTGYDFALGALRDLIPLLFSNGDYFRCVDYANLAESLVAKTSSTELEREENSLEYFAWKINALVFLKRTDQAGRQLTKKIDFAEHNKETHLLGNLYGLYGSVLRDEKKPHEAIDNYKKCFAYNYRIKFNAGCASALNNIGFVYSTILHQDKTAIQYYFKSLKFADTNEALNIYDNIANIYKKERKYDSAFFYFQRAFDQLRPGITEKDLFKENIFGSGSEITEYLTGMVLDKAATYLSKYKEAGDKDALVKAINIYRITDQYFGKLKSIQSDIQSKLFWKSNNRRLYEQAIEACYLKKDIEQAFYFFEKSRAVLLNDQVNEQRWMADADIANQNTLKKNILDLNLKLTSTSPSSDEYLKIQKDLYLKNQQLDILTDIIKKKNPLYYKNYLDTSFILVSQLRKNILVNSKSLIEIFSGDSAIYVLIITSNNQSLAKINKQLYDSLATLFNLCISNPGLLNKDFKGWLNTSHQLYALVFQNNIIPDGSIIISPDGINYPFEALVINGTHEPDYFLNHYAISYTYSVKYLTNEFTENTTASNTIFGIAPVQYKSYLNLAPLAGSDHSLNKIDDYFSNATNYVLGKATKNNFLQFFPDYAIVQLYTHASDTSDNNDPVIYFADSALYLSSLLPDRKPLTQLVVLSACETANGKFYQGEGIFSFNRGFAALGIPAAISNLWSVENESTYRITELFYKYLSKGLPTDVALQKAKLEFINKSDSKEKKLPYFWAGAILTGKVDTFKSNHSLPWLEITIVLIMLLGVTFLVRKFLLQKKASQNMQ